MDSDIFANRFISDIGLPFSTNDIIPILNVGVIYDYFHFFIKIPITLIVSKYFVVSAIVC